MTKIHCYFLIFCTALAAGPFLLAKEGADWETLVKQATQASQRGEHVQAAAHLSAAIQLDASRAEAYYLRGRENFQAGKITESVADFDQYVKLQPKDESRQWERGISYYYAGQYEKGAKQFELYQTYHDKDVENSVWRYLCVARQDGVAKARENMLPIEGDTRIPMTQIYDLFRGKLTPAVVLEAASVGNPAKEALNQRLFYAQLYIGLWYEAEGQADEAKKHLLTAEAHKIGHYMWDVAHVHADRLRAAEKEKEKK